MIIALVFIFTCGLLHPVAAQDVACAVSRDAAGRTTYSVAVPAASGCEYSWSDDKVLANHIGGIPGVVLRNRINELVTSECFGNIVYKLSCLSEGYHSVNCTTSCTANALSGPQKDEEISQPNKSNWTVAVSVLGVLGVLGAVCILGFGFWYCFPRQSWMNGNRIYACVKMLNQKAEDVEAGNE